MARSFKIAGAIALAATAACTTDPTAPNVKSSELAIASVAAASTNSVVVTESDVARQIEDTPPTRSWVFYTRVASLATGAFVTGPSTPPLGAGSFEMSTPLATDKGTLFNYDHVGIRLADINAIRYATFRDPASTAPAVQLPTINIEVDFNGPDLTGGFTSLVFEPVYNPDEGAIQSGIWQTWNAIPGIWWSTRPINGCAVVPCYQSWSDIVAANPNATILGGFGVNQGSGSGGLIAATDALTFGVNRDRWIYNFEPFRTFRTPVTKDDCKDGGWQHVTAADGSPFKNQGQCIKYVNETSHKD